MKIFFQTADIENLSELKSIEIKEGADLSSLFSLIENTEGLNKKDFKYIYINNDIVNIDKITRLKEYDLLTFSNFPEMNIVIGIIINIAIGFIMRALMGKPKEPDTGKSRTIYSNQIEQIEAAIGDPIAVVFGSVRSYPKLISGVYSFFDNQVEHTVLHVSSGVEELNTKQVFFNETKIEEYDVSWSKYGVGSRGSTYDQVLSSRFQDSRIRYITHKTPEMDSVNLNDQNQTIGGSIINPRDTKINKVLISFNFSGGINTYDDEGNIQSATFSAEISCIEVDENENETGYKKTKTVTYSEADKNQLRYSEFIDLPPSRYKIKVKRLTGKLEKGTTDCSVINVFGFDESSSMVGTERVNFFTFVIRANKKISTNSNMKINIYQERKNISTLRETVEDIWTNKDYGLGLDLEYLEIREELNESCDFLMDREDTGYNTIFNLLKSYGYIIYPYVSRFVIIKDGLRNFSTMTFNSENCSEINYTYNTPSVEEREKGVRVRYLKKGDLNFSQFDFPTSMSSYEEVVLFGVSDEKKAKARAISLNVRRLQNLKIVNISTTMEGFIVEIGSKISVLNETIDDNFSVRGYVENGILKFSQNVNLNYGDFFILTNKDNKVSKMFEVFEFGFINEITVGNIDSDFIGVDIVVSVGKGVGFMEDFIVTSIETDDKIETVNESITVKIVGEKYKEEVYQYV